MINKGRYGGGFGIMPIGEGIKKAIKKPMKSKPTKMPKTPKASKPMLGAAKGMSQMMNRRSGMGGAVGAMGSLLKKR